MLSVSQSLPQQNRSVRFSSEVDVQAEQRAIRKDRKKVNKLLLQSDVAFVVDIDHALKLFREAKTIIDKRSFTDKETNLDISSREKAFSLYGYSA